MKVRAQESHSAVWVSLPCEASIASQYAVSARALRQCLACSLSPAARSAPACSSRARSRCSRHWRSRSSARCLACALAFFPLTFVAPRPHVRPPQPVPRSPPAGRRVAPRAASACDPPARAPAVKEPGDGRVQLDVELSARVRVVAPRGKLPVSVPGRVAVDVAVAGDFLLPGPACMDEVLSQPQPRRALRPPRSAGDRPWWQSKSCARRRRASGRGPRRFSLVACPRARSHRGSGWRGKLRA